MSKETSSFSMRRGTDERNVVHKPVHDHHPSEQAQFADALKEGRRVICLGNFNDENQMVATRIDIRDGK